MWAPARVAIVALNTYREAVRARVLHGLFALALATGGYALVVGAFVQRAELRTVSDLASASISLYGVIIAIVLGATSLYRELELKTLFPILARPVRRGEYLVGKYLGTVLTLVVFVAANTGAVLLAVAQLAGQSVLLCAAVGLGSVALALVVAWRRRRIAWLLPIVWSLLLLVLGFWLAAGAPDDRRVLLASACLTVCEVLIVAGIATLFASFSSPFLTALFTLGVFVVGRSADTLARLPLKLFGETIRSAGEMVSRVVPNLMLYVPERPLLTGEAAGTELLSYLGMAFAHALLWAVMLLVFAVLVFRRRDFL